MEKGAKIVRELRHLGLPCEIFTGGGTGTFEIDVSIEEITDVQPGSYTGFFFFAKWLIITNYMKIFLSNGCRISNHWIK